MRWLACLLAVGLVLGAVASSGARADPPPVPDAGSARVASSPMLADGGTALSAEDQKVVANLDLLEHLDEVRNLDLLIALSDDSDGGAP